MRGKSLQDFPRGSYYDIAQGKDARQIGLSWHPPNTERGATRAARGWWKYLSTVGVAPALCLCG